MNHIRLVAGSLQPFSFIVLLIVLFAVLVSCSDAPVNMATPTESTSSVTPLAIERETSPQENGPSGATTAATLSPEPYAYPVASPTVRAYGYPEMPPTRPAIHTPAPTENAGSDEDIAYLPFTGRGVTPESPAISTVPLTATPPSVIVTPTAQASPTAVRPSPTPEPVATLDVLAWLAELEGTDRQLAFSKIGFHVTFLEEKGVLDQWMAELDAAGIPFFLKTVDNAEPLFKAQQLAQESGVPHTLVFRATGGVPDYSLPPDEAARRHWAFHRDKFPPELDPEIVWVETINEVDKNRSGWLAEFALATARLAMADGFRWAAFGWATGEPEPHHWELTAMLEFLRLAGENPDRLAIALHEYSLSAEGGLHELYPYRVGRFLQLFDTVDRYGIPRPTVLITEFGWEYNNIPPLEQAMGDIAWASNLYANFPEVKGAAIWNLGAGCCFGTVSGEVHELIDPIRRFNLTTSYAIPRPPRQSPLDPEAYQ